jgi:hypothetical protein
VNFLKYSFPLYEQPGEGGGAAPSPSEPPAGSPPAPEPSPSPGPAPSEFPASTGGREVPANFDETTAFTLDAFDALNRDEVDPPDDVPEVPEVPQVSVSPPIVPEPPPPTPVQVGTTPPAVPAVPVGVPPASSQPPSVPAVVAPQPNQVDPANMSFEQIAEALQREQGAVVQQLAAAKYQLTPEDIEAFQLNPEKVLPKILAQAQINTTASVMKVFAQQLPVVVNGLIEAQRRHVQAEEHFWQVNSHLDRTKHRDVVEKTMQTMRALNPSMDAQTFIKQVGMYAGMQAGIAPQMVSPAATGTGLPAAVRTPGPVVRNTNGAGAFAPVGANTAPPSAHPVPQQSEWERIMGLIQADESGAFDS